MEVLAYFLLSAHAVQWRPSSWKIVHSRYVCLHEVRHYAAILLRLCRPQNMKHFSVIVAVLLYQDLDSVRHPRIPCTGDHPGQCSALRTVSVYFGAVYSSVQQNITSPMAPFPRCCGCTAHQQRRISLFDHIWAGCACGGPYNLHESMFPYSSVVA